MAGYTEQSHEVAHETPGTTLKRWEANGIESSLGLAGTSVWRLESIIRDGILSIQALGCSGHMPSRYEGNNFTFMAPLPGSYGHYAELDKYEALSVAQSYAKIRATQDAFSLLLKTKGFDLKQSYDFMNDNDGFDPLLLTFFALSKRSLRKLTRNLRKDLPISNQEFRYLNRNVRMMTGVVLGIDPLVQQTHNVVPGLDDPSYEAIIDLGPRSDMPASFIKGIYIPPLISDFEREELERIRALAE